MTSQITWIIYIYIIKGLICQTFTATEHGSLTFNSYGHKSMKQLNFFRKFMPSLIAYSDLYLMDNEISFMIVKTFTRLHVYR